jgi:hypothetical protein
VKETVDEQFPCFWALWQSWCMPSADADAGAKKRTPAPAGGHLFNVNTPNSAVWVNRRVGELKECRQGTAQYSLSMVA